MKRKRFKRNRLASSENYASSKRLHIQYLREWHEENVSLLEEITVKQRYIRVFGQLVQVSEEELRMHNTLILY